MIVSTAVMAASSEARGRPWSRLPSASTSRCRQAGPSLCRALRVPRQIVGRRRVDFYCAFLRLDRTAVPLHPNLCEFSTQEKNDRSIVDPDKNDSEGSRGTECVRGIAVSEVQPDRKSTDREQHRSNECPHPYIFPADLCVRQHFEHHRKESPHNEQPNHDLHNLADDFTATAEIVVEQIAERGNRRRYYK